MGAKPKKLTPSTIITLWLAYLGTLSAWCWMTICYSKDIISSRFVTQFIDADTPKRVADFNLPAFTIPQEIINVLGTIFAVLAIVFVVIEIIRAPKRTQDISEQAIQYSSNSLTPLITKRLDLNTTQKRTVHFSVVYAIRLLFSWSPLLLINTLGVQQSFVPYEYMAFGAAVSATMASIFFTWILLFELYQKSQGIRKRD